MQPRSAKLYLYSMNNVAEDFLRRIEFLRKQNPKGELPENFLNEMNKWALESICVVGLNKRLGLLDPLTPNLEAEQFIKDVLNMFDYLNDLDVKLSPWKYISTPKYRAFIKTMNRITE